ncbi:MAG: paraquat-inducible protein A [Pseudomonadota bacterium]
MKDKLDIKKYWGCPCCDLLVEKRPVNYHQKASCPRCNKTLARPVKNSVEKTLALSLGTLILFFPAILTPIMTLNLLGFSQQQSIVQSMLAVFQEGHALVAAVIFITCIMVPFLQMSILFYVSLALYKNLHLPLIHFSFKIYHAIEEWGMLEIYMLAILVSVIKLEHMAELSFNLGMIMFGLLLILTLLSSVFLDEEFFWEKLGDRKIWNELGESKT